MLAQMGCDERSLPSGGVASRDLLVARSALQRHQLTHQAHELVRLQRRTVGREIVQKPDVFIVSQPTWGVDAGAASVIRQALIDLAKSGSAAKSLLMK